MAHVPLRCLVVLHIALALTILAGPSASANGWCRTDPIISIDGYEASIYVVTEAESDVRAQSHASITVEYPWQSDGELVWVDPDHGFGYGINVQVVPSNSVGYIANGIQVRITVKVSTPQTWQPVMVDWAPGPVGSAIYASAVGTTGRKIVLNTVLPTS